MTDASKDIQVGTEEASTNFYWTFGTTEVFSIQTTIRGNPTPAEIDAHLASAIRGMARVTGLGGHAKVQSGGKVESAAMPQTTPTQAAIETGKAVAPPVSAKPTTSNAPLAGKAVSEVISTKIEVLPKPDGKCEVKFYDDDPNHKYAAIYGTKPVTTWAAMLGWQPDAFSVPATYTSTSEGPIRLTIGYTLSDKLNSKGNPYKDIQYIK